MRFNSLSRPRRSPERAFLTVLQFKPEYLEQGKSGARLVRQLFIDMIAASYFIDRRFVHIEVLVDCDALAHEAGFWNNRNVSEKSIREFFDGLRSHPHITVVEGELDTKVAVMHRTFFPLPISRHL